MVKLVLEDVYQISILELELIRYDIPYEVVSNQFRTFKPIPPPYLLVHGVPLDLEQSLKWIKEYAVDV
jgi:hypothetical protein